MTFNTLNEKSFKATIKTIAKVGESIRSRLHDAGMYAVIQSFNGNPNPAKDLIQAMGSALRADAMKRWLTHYGALQYDATIKGMKYRKIKDFGPENHDARIAEADANPFDNFKAEAKESTKEFNFLEHIQSAIKTAEKIQSGKKAGKLETVVNAEKLTAVKGILADGAAQDLIAEGTSAQAIAESIAKRKDAQEILDALCVALGYEVEVVAPVQATGTNG